MKMPALISRAFCFLKRWDAIMQLWYKFESGKVMKKKKNPADKWDQMNIRLLSPGDQGWLPGGDGIWVRDLRLCPWTLPSRPGEPQAWRRRCKRGGRQSPPAETPKVGEGVSGWCGPCMLDYGRGCGCRLWSCWVHFVWDRGNQERWMFFRRVSKMIRAVL